MTAKSLYGEVVKKKLDNGLTVLLKQDRSSPIVAVNVWFDVGSVHETDEMNGLAHFQEHMVFKGTPKYGVGDIPNLVKSCGGNLNAGTSYSYTMYYIVLPSRSFSRALEIQSDAMMNSLFDLEEFNKERLVVIDEARMYDDRPESFTFYRTMELAFEKHNYRRPIAGYQTVVEKITRDQLLDFYNNYYRPSNAVLVVVGDVDPAEAHEKIEEYYGGWKPGVVKRGESPVEPPQTAFRFKTSRGDIDHGYLAAGFHTPSILHEDYPALEMLSQLLSSGRSSRLYRTVLEEKRLVTSVSAGLLAEKWPGLFVFKASTPPDKLSAAREAIFCEVKKLKNDPVGEEELEKARRQLERALCVELETMEGQASNLGYYQLLGDYRLADRHREAIKSVTPEQILNVAQKYFTPENCSLMTYAPEGRGEVDADFEKVEAAVRGCLGGGAVGSEMPTPGAIKREKTRRAAASPARPSKRKGKKETAISLFALDNGVRVLLKKRPALPMVSVLTVFNGGARLEPPGKSGLSALAHRSLTKGSGSYDAEEIVRLVESAGGKIDSYANFDSSGIHVNVLSEYLDEVLPVYREVARAPRFDEERVVQERDKLLEEMAQRRDNPVQFAMDRLFQKIFAGHPYAYPFVGDPQEVKGLAGTDCSSWYGGILVPENMVLSFVGDISEKRAREVAEFLYGDLRPGEAPQPARKAPEFPVEPGVFTFTRKHLKQSVALVGFTAPPMMTPEALGLKVLNGVMTGLGGRLFVELRDKRSLGYMTGSSFSTMLERSVFLGYANPGAEGVDEALDVMLRELDRVSREEISPAELARSKEWLTGTQIMQLQSSYAQASAYGTYEALGFGYDVVARIPDLIQNVGAGDIVSASSRTFVRDRAVLIKFLPGA